MPACNYLIVETETRAQDFEGNVSYVPHFEYPHTTPPQDKSFVSSYGEVRRWHAASIPSRLDSHSVRTCSRRQQCRSLQILFKFMGRRFIRQCNVSVSTSWSKATLSSVTTRQSATVTDGTTTSASWVERRRPTRRTKLARSRSSDDRWSGMYRREQDKKAQMTKQTRELDRLSA